MAALSFLVATLAGGVLLVWASVDPVRVIVGTDGRHDEASAASCLDCHVPFVGTPSSRCLAPGCHGDLATGTPPLTGPALPLRYHAALRKYACATCHQEHGPQEARAFDHHLIPDAARGKCRSCHPGSSVKSHARTDAVSCDLCHGLTRWRGASIVHDRVGQQPCDLCHRRPESDAHVSVAGACSDCHGTVDWAPRAQDDAK